MILEEYTVDQCTESERINDYVRVDEHEGEIIYYFHPKRYQVDDAEMREVINGLIFNNECSGADLARLASGEIRVYFNPMMHCWLSRKTVTKKIISAIKQPNPNTTI